MKVLKNFFVLEGVDGVGKSTVLSILGGGATRLVGGEHSDIYVTEEPTDSPAGQLARKLLEGEEKPDSIQLAYLFAADRHDHLYKKGGIYDHVFDVPVFCGRYRFSNEVYQGLAGRTYPYGKEPGKLVWELNRDFPWPRIVFFLDAPVDVIAERLMKRDGKADKKRIEQLRKAYLAHFDYLEERGPKGMDIVTIDATLEDYVISGKIYSIASRTMRKDKEGK